MTWHLIPKIDLIEHDEIGCQCDPRVNILENGDILITHHDLGGTDGTEITNQILKPEN